MKLYTDYNKQFSSRVFRALLIVFFTTAILYPVFFTHLAYGETAESIQNKINQKDSDIAKLEKEIKIFQAQLNSIGKEKSSLSKSLKELDVTRKKLTADINVTQNKIDKTNFTIESLSTDITGKQNTITTGMESIELELRKINELEQNSIVEVILSDESFSVIWNDIDNIFTVREKLRESLVEVKHTKVQLEGTRDETVVAKNKLNTLKSELGDQKKIVQQNVNQKNQLLKQTKNNEANYQKLVRDRLAKKEAFEKELQDFEAQLKFILDPSKLPSAGVLSWPLNKIFVTSPYGARWGRQHRGTDFRASVGTSVKAMSSGVVKGVGDTDVCCPGASFGKWILIEYDNGLSSTYGHLSLTRVQKGQRVGRGELVGYSGNSGSSTGPHLHVSVYVSSGVKVDSFASKSYPGRTLTQPIAATNAYLDPMFYLPSL